MDFQLRGQASLPGKKGKPGEAVSQQANKWAQRSGTVYNIMDGVKDLKFGWEPGLAIY